MKYSKNEATFQYLVIRLTIAEHYCRFLLYYSFNFCHILTAIADRPALEMIGLQLILNNASILLSPSVFAVSRLMINLIKGEEYANIDHLEHSESSSFTTG
jgi:hypothetical protein